MNRLPPARRPAFRYPDHPYVANARTATWHRLLWPPMQPASHAPVPVLAGECPAPAPVPRSSGVKWRRWAATAALLLLPLLVYWPTIGFHFGFRDDYSILREARAEPGKLLRVCAMQARPIYGWLLEPTFRMAGDIGGLAGIRAGAALMIGAVAAALFLFLCSLRWDRWISFFLAGLLIVLPSSQVVVAWATAWPLAASLLLAIAAFACAERAFRKPARNDAPGSGRRSFGWWTAAVFLVTASALVYQPNTLFYLTGVAAALWSRRRQANRNALEWLVRHAVTLGIGLMSAFTIMVVVFAQGWLPASRRVAFEHDWVGKFGWFVREPLQNALGLVVLNHDGGAPQVHRAAALIAIVIVAGFVRGCFIRGWRHGLWWTGALMCLLVGSFAVNLAVADRWPAYRVLLPLTATVGIALAVALLTLGGKWLARAGLIALLLPGLWLARQQTLELFAKPQAIELDLLNAGAARINPAVHPKVFVIVPWVEEHITPDVFLDEFGSLSSTSYWTPKEMLILLMRERYPTIPDIATRYDFECGPALPKDEVFDVVIDLHRVREFRPDASKI